MRRPCEHAALLSKLYDVSQGPIARYVTRDKACRILPSALKASKGGSMARGVAPVQRRGVLSLTRVFVAARACYLQADVIGTEGAEIEV